MARQKIYASKIEKERIYRQRIKDRNDGSYETYKAKARARAEKFRQNVMAKKHELDTITTRVLFPNVQKSTPLELITEATQFKYPNSNKTEVLYLPKANIATHAAVLKSLNRLNRIHPISWNKSMATGHKTRDEVSGMQIKTVNKWGIWIGGSKQKGSQLRAQKQIILDKRAYTVHDFYLRLRKLGVIQATIDTVKKLVSKKDFNLGCDIVHRAFREVPHLPFLWPRDTQPFSHLYTLSNLSTKHEKKTNHSLVPTVCSCFGSIMDCKDQFVMESFGYSLAYQPGAVVIAFLEDIPYRVDLSDEIGERHTIMHFLQKDLVDEVVQART